MAHLLGSKFCIDSLRNDVTDIHCTIVDIFGRVGPVQCSSWKYPDKISSELDINEILEIYDYSDDEEERQVAHIVLLEMVIDRFVLLLQSLTKYIDGAGIVQTTPTDSHTSIGLVVKKYWNKMMQTFTSVQQMQTEKKAAAKKISDLENEVKKLNEESESLHETVSTMEDAARNVATCQTPFPLNDTDAAIVRALTSASNYSISKDEYNKATQTLETAFVPCESCDYVQKNLYAVGDAVIGVCSSQGLPSSLVKYKTQIEGLDWLTGNDIARWTCEQNKDLSRINKHLLALEGTIKPLEEEVASANKKAKEMEKRMVNAEKEMKLERETSSTERKQFRSRLDDLQKENAEKIDKIQKEKEDVEKGKKELNQQIGTMKEKLQEQKQLLLDLESAKKQLTDDLTSNQANHEQVQELEDNMSALTSQLDQVKDKLKSSNQELSKERAKVKSMNKQNESIQCKQDSLLQRLNELSTESEELRDQVAELEDEKDQLEVKLDKAREKKEEAEQKLKEEQTLVEELQRDKDTLEQSMTELREDISSLEQKLTDAKERERLIVEYPDLNGPVNPDLAGTGDIIVDMENQVKANSARIQLLEEQNQKLRRTVTKMMQRQDNGQKQIASKPMPLWSNPADGNIQSNSLSNIDQDQAPYKTGTTDHLLQQQQPKYELPPRPPSNKKETIQQQMIPQHEIIVGRGAKSNKSRPTSATKKNESSVGAYTALKKSGLLKGRPLSGKSTVSNGSLPDVHACTRCSKTYNNPKDLEIHNTYCY